jgi:hypothetical protein
VPREHNSAADNWCGLRLPILATVAALLLGAVCYVFDSHFGESGFALTPTPALTHR